ncbi:MAG: hypothetical protein ABIF19_18880 [Planctomycetota bacterium]
MLSFLREQSGGNLSAEKQEKQTVPVEGVAKGAETPQEQEYFTVAAHGSRTRKSTIFLAVFFIIGMLCLWFMIRKSTPHAASAETVDAEETKLEAAVARLTGVESEVFSNMDGLVKKFYEFSDVLQVQVSELVKNPFKLELLLPEFKEEPVVETAGPEIDSLALLRQRMLQKTRNMELLSIMRTDQGDCCMIGSRILYEGDRIDDFKVSVISDYFVKLKWDPEDGNALTGAQPEVVEIVLKLSN